MRDQQAVLQLIHIDLFGMDMVGDEILETGPEPLLRRLPG
jgi:hypothetical protein